MLYEGKEVKVTSRKKYLYLDYIFKYDHIRFDAILKEVKRREMSCMLRSYKKCLSIFVRKDRRSIRRCGRGSVGRR